MFRASDSDLEKALETCDESKLQQIEKKYGLDLSEYRRKRSKQNEGQKVSAQPNRVEKVMKFKKTSQQEIGES